MELKKLIPDFKNCPCGREHKFDLKTYVADTGVVNEVGRLLKEANFPNKILIVTDSNALNAANGIIESIEKAGFKYRLKQYPDMKYAYMSDSEEIMEESKEFDGILSIGTGSVNDICRYAAYKVNKEFAIFATAPSMDGFASDSAPLIKDNFKISYQCKQPSVILADTNILAEAPLELKSAGYGDIVAKYVGIVDWKFSHYVSGEYICDNIVKLVKDTVNNVVAHTDRVNSKDPSAAGAIMDALIVTGCAMQLAHCTRPASGAEHIISHFWEIHKLEQGIWPDYHGKKVGLATCLLLPIYKSLLDYDKVNLLPERLDLDDVLKHYSSRNRDEIIKYNIPSIVDTISKEQLIKHWEDIKESIKNDLPDYDTFISNMKKAGCVTQIEEAHISKEFAEEAIKYSPYMRRRITILRVLSLLEKK